MKLKINCEICGYNASYPTVLKSHITRKHKGDQKEILRDEKHDKSLLRSSNYEVRSLSFKSLSSPTPLEHSPLTFHSPQRPNPLTHSTLLRHAQEIQCPVCGQAFQHADMNIHIEKMHSVLTMRKEPYSYYIAKMKRICTLVQDFQVKS